jgi:hypothetical protein
VLLLDLALSSDVDEEYGALRGDAVFAESIKETETRDCVEGYADNDPEFVV